jgi:hypothetical protein
MGALFGGISRFTDAFGIHHLSASTTHCDLWELRPTLQVADIHVTSLDIAILTATNCAPVHVRTPASREDKHQFPHAWT